MGQPNRRTGTPHNGRWAVEKPSAQGASSVHDTQEEAIAAARQTLQSSGGELGAMGRDGPVRQQDASPRGNDLRASKG